MSDSFLYSRLLLAKGQGYPLFHPQPYDDLPLEARQNGTQIGDVGTVTTDGSFDPIFNICKSAGDPLNRFGVPDGFEQVMLNPEDIAPKNMYYSPGTDISNTKINKRRLDIEAGVDGNVFFPLGAGAVVEISTSSKATAVLLLPQGASRSNLRPLQIFRDYAIKHGQSWYSFVNGKLNRMIGTGELYLITGVDKSTSWSVAALENNYDGCELSLKLKPAFVGSGSVSYAWEWECASSFANSGPRYSPGEETWTDNQTVFLRGFKVAIRPMPLKKSGKVVVHSVADTKHASGSVPKSRFGMPFLWGGSGNIGGLSRSNTRSTSGDTLDSNLDYKPFHPADAINDYLLENFSDVAVAITHDDEWAAVLGEDKIIPTAPEMVERICEGYDIKTTSNGVFLQRMDENHENMAIETRAISSLPTEYESIKPNALSSQFPQIKRADLRARLFPELSQGVPVHEFEDPATGATPDIEHLEFLGESVIRVAVTSLISEMYPGLRVDPATNLRDLVMDNPTFEKISKNTKFLENAVKTASLMHGTPVHVVFKAFFGALYLDQGNEATKPILDSLFHPYTTSAYEFLRRTYGSPSQQENIATKVPSIVAQSPPASPSDVSSNFLALFNESAQKGNRKVDWNYGDHPSAGTASPQSSPPRGNTAQTTKWVVEVLVDGEVFGRGEGSTKKAARNEAARQALSQLSAAGGV
ncbi:ribonuclease III [Favolaschia claudopus]|uniref:Ribonuclease III n=1 Tax=Favolaschia claudopus TaxID=2862362 RepID=A0AAW0DQI8_9AGAR